MAHINDVELGWPYPKRKEFLRKLKESGTSKYNYPLKFQGSIDYYGVYRVELGLPKYRLLNGRTQAAQEEYLAKHPKLNIDFFSRDMELDSVQRVQHELLLKMVEGTSLLTYFKEILNKQEQPLILTEEGFVVNGNRRLCAMRELFYEDKQKYGHFAHIDVLILPPCSLKDIDEVEAYLQIQPDIRDDYSWIAKACMLRARQIQHNYSIEELSSLYDIPQKEIKNILAQLAMVDIYLSSRGKDKQYDLVETQEYAFKQLHKGRSQLKSEIRRDAFTQLVFVLLDNPESFEGRIYDHIPQIKEHLNNITTELAEELSITPSTESQPPLVDELFGTPEPSNNNMELIIQTSVDPQNHARVIETIFDVLDSEKESKKQKNRANAVLKEISEANAHLKNALCYISNDSSKNGVIEHLKAIEESVTAIRKWIS
jgi:hypothetical protein